MTDHRFRILDVFARRKYAGNQLAVVEDAADLSTAEMAAVADEMNYSETTFVETTEPVDGAWPTRIFTPEGEIPFAGHPTLGTARVVREHLADGTPDAVVLDLEVGEVPVRWDTGEGGVPRMSQREPTFGEELDHDALAAALSLDPGDLDREWPVQVVSTGLPTVVVPVADLAALRRAGIDRPAYDRVVEGRDAKNVLAFCRESHHGSDGRDDRGGDRKSESGDGDVLSVRVFAPAHGVPEDPATGSSNGCLAGYLVRHGDGPVDATVEQGHEMGRPSRLLLSARSSGGGIDVEVGGEVVPVAEGQLL